MGNAGKATYKSIMVNSQKEFDDISSDFVGSIRIKFGNETNRAVVNRVFENAVIVVGDNHCVTVKNARIDAEGCSKIAAFGNSIVKAYENSSVYAYENSTVYANGGCFVSVDGDCVVYATGRCTVRAFFGSKVYASDSSVVEVNGNCVCDAYDYSTVAAFGNAVVDAFDSSIVKAFNISDIKAHGNSCVLAYEESHVYASGSSRVVVCDKLASVGLLGPNAVVLRQPGTIDEYVSFYSVRETADTVVLYKAVHKRDGRYHSDYDKEFEYVVGEEAVSTKFDRDRGIICSYGIHMATLEWCLRYGHSWKDLAILEVEARKGDIVVPEGGEEKVRARAVRVIREVPLVECGILGEYLLRTKGR